jgi:peptidoglycan/xylan/chitin deacetylase (PgdA/CDA1 family)
VVTGWIGTTVVPFWDRARSVRHPWMSWDHVRSLHARGFDVGAHTRTHVDLGTVAAATAEREIFGARLDLQERLDAPVESFAYPYGGRQHLTEANRQIVKAAGFRCCCAGFGGTVSSDTSPFCLGRVPISPWYASAHQFGLEVALGRSLQPT